MNKIKSFEYLDTSDRILKLKEVVSYINDMLFYLKDDGFNIDIKLMTVRTIHKFNNISKDLKIVITRKDPFYLNDIVSDILTINNYLQITFSYLEVEYKIDNMIYKSNSYNMIDNGAGHRKNLIIRTPVEIGYKFT